MTDAFEPPKIVPLASRLDATTGERVGELLNAVRGIAGKRLQQCLGNLFEHVDDALFDIAEKAENNATQTHYFDGMREVRKRRPAVERSFLAMVNRELGALAGRAATTPAASAAPAMAELSLVADAELEESLAITSMGSKHESRLARDLFAINQRLSVICGGRKIEDASNPIAPSALSQAFRLALKELAADMRVKLLIYKLFDRYVLSTLEELYAEANETLARAGVLPQLRVAAPRGGGASRTAAPTTSATATTGASADEVTDPAAVELLQTLHNLFVARRGGETPATARAGNAGGPPPSANELLGALSVLQTQLAAGSVQQSPSMVDGTGNFDREAVSQLKEQLLGQLGALRGARPSHVAGIDEDTIDLVGMLFEFILDDHTLPPEMQALLARLQIPYLKAAILDRKLFAHRQHPARRLLDALAEQAKGWSPESDRDNRLHDKMKGIVDQLLHEFDDDLGIFERLLLDLQQFIETNRRRSELAEQRVAESTRGREKLEQARRRAAREIVERIDGRKLPPLVHEVLARAWANHLVLLLLRQGEESGEFRDALRFVDDFIASTRPMPDAASRQQLRQLLPGIERALRQGLANVAFQPQDIERLLAQLRDWYGQQLGEPARHPAPVTPAVAEAAPVAAIPESIQPIVEQHAEPEELPEESVPVDTDSSEWKQVEALQPGVWLEFQLPDEPMVRAKLSWISPMSGRYLFVNRRGLKVADYSPQELAVLLASGHAQVLATNALFDRAMSAIVSRLRQSDAPSNGTDAG
ncbi:DUF1631 domain-containing protein [Rhodanobacter sp. DHB23]|uniref:DUF1631 domain-containing protein n=1 Tax=Rhodanobacter sp. DHB23 TaxID=2775923 RepID=UPI00177F36AB|nr:DUF1631 domain-containing protein [Rhodanobacter sp. DHB23]MBD8873091.1 DUF1631 domain-containing protein [Rhodanobacter sp. DHB23]